jgi:hypothetical protein
MSHLGIGTWLRYRDDILFECSGPFECRKFINIIRSRLKGVWTLKVEQLSSVSASFLDLEVIINKSTCPNKLDFRPFAKQTKCRIPLSHESCHPFFVQTWPISEVHRLHITIRNAHFFDDAVCNFASELSAHHMRVDTIARVLCYVGSYHKLGKLGNVSKRRLGKTRTKTANLPFYPVWASEKFIEFMKHVCNLFAVELQMLRPNLGFSVCWHAVLPPLYMRLRTLEVGWGGGGLKLV